MKWMKFKIRTTTMAEDILVSGMEDIGLYGAQIEDNVPLTAAEKEQMFVDILPQGPEDDGTAVLSFYVEETEDGRLVLENGLRDPGDAAKSGGSLASVSSRDAGEEETCTPEQVCEAISNKIREMREYCDFIGDGTVTVEETQDVDWMNNWKQYFHQFWIDDILVMPSWEDPQTDGKEPACIFRIDPGTAFGTGMHETTQLCIRQIRQYLTKDTVLLDVGTGSGILAILALMFGAVRAVGTDLDPCAIPAVEENLEANGVSAGRMEMILGNLISDSETQERVGKEQYDIVVANILADVLIPLAPAAADALKPGGVFITSGIVEGREEDVAAAMKEQGLDILSVTSQGEWRCVVGHKAER
ncbi:MAG: 50S ribosomal protein L11 methyltransferase [Lachnospiraceae bacterium]|nr:50S ribosomal protein L11 methyltransferase [Lachnospiraceae bacterium]